MVLWRISNHADLSGLGAKIAEGRWHTRGEDKRITYLSEHPALSLVESLVNLRRDGTLYPATYQLLKITATADIPFLDLTAAQLASIDPENTQTTQRLGDAWLDARSSALLRVPSIASPESWNYLLNPLHGDARLLDIQWAKRITYDRRLFHLTN